MHMNLKTQNLTWFSFQRRVCAGCLFICYPFLQLSRLLCYRSQLFYINDFQGQTSLTQIKWRN